MEIRKSIDRELQELLSFFQENKINYLDVKKGSYIVDFTLKVKSYISKGEIGKGFKFQLVLEKKNDSKVIYKIFIKEGLEVPYHPNFRLLSPIPYLDLLNKYTQIELFNKKALWVGSLRKHDSVVDYVKEMILSLQFHKNYINPDNIGNKKAYQWYSDQIVRDKNIPPTDTFLEELIPSDSNQQIKKPKFNIDSDKNKRSSSKKAQFKIKKRFNITANEKYELEEKELTEEDFKIDENLNSRNKNIQSDSLLFISQKAKQQIWNHIEWGNHKTSINKNEQGGILLGKVFFDKKRKMQFAIVEDIVIGKTAKGNPTYLEMSHETWSQMLNDADEIAEEKNDNIQVIGWYHTHPNELSLYMSGTDMNTQYRFFNQNWHYAVILNPHKEIWKAFVGKEAEECKGYVLKDDDVNYTDADDTKEKSSNNSFKKKGLIILSSTIFLLTVIVFSIYLVIQKDEVIKENDPIPNEIKESHTHDTNLDNIIYNDTLLIDSIKQPILIQNSTLKDSLVNKNE
ncbi:JAB1/Mov34/MPN/PAD-1 ubiquitin protease [Kordia sp. SMS9]|uniref:Mov34/MPN/PAD-1 family protein n=1 Tax=Kordia sp. SMS9 TaxID=2282170 RepID=UPI000E0DBCF7|nr:Mov34/MPN/PAD-1 family protein [Kordia sp. SMS9]AXG72383.1 JAB1/Mov34/MPN/PAD-1 ubiquitin protease [Kordia sp. SMS9]